MKTKTKGKRLIPHDDLVNFVRDCNRLEFDKPALIQALKKRFGLDTRQAHNQYNNHIKSIYESLGLELPLSSLEQQPLGFSQPNDLLSPELSQFDRNVLGLGELQQRSSDLEELPVPLFDQQPSPSPLQFVGRGVAKLFGNKIYFGRITSYDLPSRLFQVDYNDGDNEDMDEDEAQRAVSLHVVLSSHLELEGGNVATSIALNTQESGASAGKRKRSDTFSNSWDGKGGGTYLVFQLRNTDRYYEDFDPNTDLRVEGQKKGHPLRTHQNPAVKEAHRGVTDAAYFTATSINVAVSSAEDGNDLFMVLVGLHHLSHGMEYLRNKASSDEVLRNSGVDVVDVPESQERYTMQRDDDGINVFRSGTLEADRVSMRSTEVKREFLRHLISPGFDMYRSADSGRDIGNHVYRFDLVFNQGQRTSHVYAGADGIVVLDSKGKPLRVPFLRHETSMIRMLPENVKAAFTQVLIGMDELSKQLYPGAFHDGRRRQLVYDHFSRDHLGHCVSINWEYIGIIARKITDDDRLAMHLDNNNDSRQGYDICATYSYIIDGWRVTVVAACKQDFGSLFERLDEVGAVEGGRFLPPDQVRRS